MNLYVRVRNKYINFLHSVQEFKQFQDMYIPGTPVLIGDISYFNKHMLNMLLKFIEENPAVDCYSTMDVQDPIILSRTVGIFKDPIPLVESASIEEFKQSDRGFVAIQEHLHSMSYQKKLLCYKIDDRNLSVMESV